MPVDRDTLAAAIFAKNVDTTQPLYYQKQVEDSYTAADIFLKYASKQQPDNPDSELLEQLQKLLKNGKKIQAIKELRAAKGVGLKEAKDIVDSYESSGRWDMSIPDMYDKFRTLSTADLHWRDHAVGLFPKGTK